MLKNRRGAHMKNLRKVLWQAFLGSIDHPGGGVIILIYLFVLIAIASTIGLALSGNRTTGSDKFTMAIAGLSLLALLLGYIFNKKERYGKVS